MKKAIITGIGVMGMFITGYAEQVDSLKPVFQKQEQAFKRLMDKWMTDGMEYDVRVELERLAPKKTTLEHFTKICTLMIQKKSMRPRR